MGCETAASATEVARIGVNPGLGLGVNSGLGLYRDFLDLYNTLHFIDLNGKIVEQHTIVYHTTEVLRRHGLQETDEIQQVAGVYIYPREYFCPIDTVTRRLHVSDNTFTIHHYAASWIVPTWRRRLKMSLLKILPEGGVRWWNRHSVK